MGGGVLTILASKLLEHRPIFEGMKSNVVQFSDEILTKSECKIWSRIYKIDSW